MMISVIFQFFAFYPNPEGRIEKFLRKMKCRNIPMISVFDMNLIIFRTDKTTLSDSCQRHTPIKKSETVCFIRMNAC